ncbi:MULTISPECIES: antitoxin [Tsukamurella]|uniref:Antitoxin n=1 Tax=Tsukamurella strandjordii TaxID=147577 RepID=A0AA90NGT6_9ACTN|nr:MULTISPECIES: antitoxin [Tsukamurella]MDP0398036.1 antitoxin [Tsukamurella strandjordii]
MDFKDIANKAKDALGKNPSIIDKAGDFVDSKTGGKFSEQVNKAQDAAKKFIDDKEIQVEQEARDPQADQPKPDQQ